MSFGREDCELSFFHVCQEIAPLKDDGLHWSGMSQMLLLWKDQCSTEVYSWRPVQALLKIKKKLSLATKTSEWSTPKLLGAYLHSGFPDCFLVKVRFANVSLLIIVSVTQLSYQGSPFSHTGTSSFHLQLLILYIISMEKCVILNLVILFFEQLSHLWIFFRSIISWKFLSIICFGFQ